LTQQAVVVLVTGSEQVQTEECVRLLAMRGVDTDRILVHGSLYGCDAETGRFHGAVEHLNVTLEGKRDAVRAFREDPTLRVAAAMGNSRPDRALLEAVHPKGLRVLVCSRSILQRRDVRTFALRKYRRSGFHLVWDLDEYRTAVDQCGDMRADDSPQPVLVTDCNYRNMLDNGQLRLECNRCLSEPHRGPAGRTAPRPLYQEAG
jgi:hypothetical protein